MTIFKQKSDIIPNFQHPSEEKLFHCMFNIKQNLKEKPIENIKIGKFTNTALQLPSRHNINMLY